MNSFKITYPPQLPVSQEIDRIKQFVMTNQVVIVCGETGSGKTTQLPKMLYELGFAKNGIIGHTQPRKVAARTIAHRINHEISDANQTDSSKLEIISESISISEHINIVGYKVRFNDKTSPHTKIKLMTDGILLQEIAHDKLLRGYSALIIDEAHERSLNIDFILGYLKTIVNSRPDLKIIITSATIDNQKLSKYFNNAPVIDVEGKTYPVDIIYQPIEESNLNNAIYKAVESCLSVEQGNILIFLPGEREIRDCLTYLRKTTLRRYELLPLFSRQSEVEQNLVFTQNGKLKIIVTTNVAETSLTIPGVKFVIDSGIARVKRYNMRNKVEQLLIEPIAKANCLQRAGRAGRTSHGMCIRLFSEEDFNLRPQFSDPEIIRSNLANVILRLIGLRLGNPLEFPFLDMPVSSAYSDGFKTLFQLQAIDDNNRITALGRLLVKIPLDASLASILIAAASEFNCLNDALIIVSFLAIIDPRETPMDVRQLAKEKHSIWANKKSDFVAILNLWHWYSHEVEHKKSNKKLQEKCYSQFLSFLRMREWHELHSQLKEIMHNLGFKGDINDVPVVLNDVTMELSQDNYQRLHQSILSGLLNNIGKKDLVEDFYIGTNNKKFIFHPSSNVDKSKWVVSAILSQTTRLYARTNAYIEPAWLIPLTRHLAKSIYSNETWDKKRGEVVATEHILFQGLEIGKRKIGFSKQDPVLSREIFIKQGIVPNELGKNYKFILHNNQVISSLEELEDKLRLSFIIMEDELFEFYNNILPADIVDIRTFDVWCNQNEMSLYLNKEELIKKLVTDSSHLELYPDYLLASGEKLKLSYIFNPDSLADGVTAKIFLTKLNNINEDIFSWLVPGLIRDKINFIIKALPKYIRVTLNPLNEFITKFLEQVRQTEHFSIILANYLKSQYKIEVKISEINSIVLPPHLCFHFQILDRNKSIAYGDNLLELKRQLAPTLGHLVNEKARDYCITDITNWTIDLNQLLQMVDKLGYYSLEIRDSKVNLIVVPDLEKAQLNTRKGLLQLIKNKLNVQIKYLEQKRFKHFDNTTLYLKDIYTSQQLLDDSINFILRMTVDLTILPKNEEEFESLIETTKQNIMNNAMDFANVIFNISTNYHEVKLKIKNHILNEEILLQLDDLLFNGFLRYVRYNQLEHFPRYLKAILKRLEKYNINPGRDKEFALEIEGLYEAWYIYIDKLEQSNLPITPALYDFKYKIEELRVSLFAQELKTPFPVSPKRLWREFEAFDK
ncbi:MAG: hrpA [Burkholderiales bacterium]|jgi:ATP-dependent helicase HrpA|nr:hrpA [Burkholderiales bacterium]